MNISYRSFQFSILTILLLQSTAQKIEPNIISDIQKNKLNYTSVDDTFNLLVNGEIYLQLGEHKDLILVLGNTGSGKSTLTQLIAGDNTKLRSVEVAADTGEYIIKDDNDKIGYGIYSKTVIPDRVIDPESNTAYYDCPGFSDTRNAAFDIASTYFIKKTLDHAKSVKLVLTISYPSLRIGVDRNDFMKLIRHTTEFIKNIDKFQNSIALIVTKVDNEYIKRGKILTLVSDEKVIYKIANYIHGVKQELMDTLKTINEPKERLFYIKAITLIDIFLTKEKSIYKNIVLFRRPDEEGLLSNIELTQDGKERMKNLIDYDLSFTTKNVHDFGFTISASSKNSILKLMEKINEQITEDILKTTDDIKEFYDYKIVNTNDVYKLKDDLNIQHKTVTKTIQEFDQSTTFKEFLTRFTNFINDMDVKNSREVLFNLYNKYKYLNFLQLVSKDNYKAKPYLWTQPLQRVVLHISESRSWYIFLVDLHDKLSYYTAYSSIHKNNLKQQLSVLTKRQKRQIDSRQMDPIFAALKKYNLNEHNNVQNIEKDAVKFNDINNVLGTFLNDNIETYCTGFDTLIVKGDFIKFSDLPTKNPCENEIKIIQIFALNSVFIDKDIIQTGKKLNILIISPKWEVIGDRQINLDGTSGDNHVDRKAARGQDGRTGLPGGPAGNFIGIGQKIINAEHLTISANGGRGGTGQVGGDGFPGIDGYTRHPTGSQYEAEQIMKETGFNYQGRTSKKSLESVGEFFGYIIGLNADIESHFYFIHGKRGTQGGKGGKGGAGGKGGHAGMVSLYGLDNGAEISILKQDGANGIPGNGGKGGPGGKNGDNLAYMFKKKEAYWFGMKRYTENRGWHQTEKYENGKAADGLNNKQISYQSIKNPEEAAAIINPSNKINNYKTYLLQNINNSAKKHNLMMFYNHFDNNSDIINMYDSFAFLNELQSLENIVYTFNNKDEVSTLYQSLLKRISNYAMNRMNDELTNSHKMLLNYLYTATLSKIISLKDKSEGNLIINIDGYFTVMMENLKKLEKYENEMVKKVYNYNFKKEIDSKISQATDLIENHIVLEIDNIISQIEHKIDLLIDEIIQMQQNSNLQIEELIEKQKELVNTIEQRGILEGLKFIKNILNFLGPIGETVNIIVQSTNQISDSMDFDEDVNIAPKYSIPERLYLLIEKGIQFAKNFLQKKENTLNHNLKTMDTMIKDHPMELGDLQPNVSEIVSNLIIKNQNDDIDIFQIIKSADILKSVLTSKNSEIMNQILENSTDSSEIQQASFFDTSNILNILNATTNLAVTFTDTYHKYQDDNRKLEKIGEAIKAHDKNIDSLQQFQMQVYQTIVPIFETMQYDITNYKSEMSSKSRVALDVSKWKIQDSFKDMKILLGKTTNEFKTHDDIKCLIDKMNEAMSTLVHVYDRIQNYKEQKELADYIAAINSIPSSYIKTNNQTIDNALIALQYIMKSNIVLDQFEKAMGSFKQFIFPFANYYLDEYEAPFHIDVEKTVENLLVKATKKINDIKLKLTENSLLLNRNFDQYVFEERFQTGDKFGGPFFVWDNYKHEKIISKLLSGEEIILKSDVLHSVHNKNAIKFNKIEINLRSRDKSVASTLADKLNFFDVTMKHFGNSYYRCDNRIYLLSSDNQTFHYSFKKDENGEPVRRNQIYTKVKNGQYILSPYATWSFQLRNSLNTSFTELNSLKGKVDLELVGHGQYVSIENNICGRDLKKYYKIDYTISMTDAIHEDDLMLGEI